MPRIDRARLDRSDAMLTTSIPIRFDDLDVQNHVNNAAAVVLLQEARLGFNRAVGLPTMIGSGIMTGLRALVAALNVEYAGEIGHPGTVEIDTGVLALGRTSFTLAQVARQGGVAKLYAEAVMVIADANGPVPLPDALRERYAAHLIREG